METSSQKVGDTASEQRADVMNAAPVRLTEQLPEGYNHTNMTTVVNTPGDRNTGDTGAGWAVAVVILIVIIGIGAYLWANNQAAPVTPAATNQENTSSSTTINVSLPGTTGNASTTTP